MPSDPSITIYHNPRCSKSRDALGMLRQRGFEPTIVEYLKTPPTTSELRSILAKLGLQPDQLVRKGEELYKAKLAGKVLDAEQWLQVLANNPILIERPIVVRGDRAIIGRPPQRIEALL